MSTPAYILAAFGCGAGFLALCWLAQCYVAQPVARLYRQWLESRRHRRLARDTDAWFEERRSLEAALQDDQPRPRRSRTGTIALWSGASFVCGMVVLNSLLAKEARPSWTELHFSIALLIGVAVTALWVIANWNNDSAFAAEYPPSSDYVPRRNYAPRATIVGGLFAVTIMAVCLILLKVGGGL